MVSLNNQGAKTSFVRGFQAIAMALLFVLAGFSSIARAGPPFITDDPEPVEYKHYEFYLASQYTNSDDGISGTAPHFELNYGVIPNVQLHMIAPCSYIKSNFELLQYGFGDTEFGIKYRFIQETAMCPQVGIFPLIEVPTGDTQRGLGNGFAKIFIPLWLQKSWGSWTTYGGGGYWHNPGADNKDYWFSGWEVQRDLSGTITVGAELFYSSASTPVGSDQTGFNIGAIVNFDEGHHLLFSAGRDFHGPGLFSLYLAYQWTFGPSVVKK